MKLQSPYTTTTQHTHRQRFIPHMQVSGDTGEVLDWLMDPHGINVATVSAAVEHDGCLFLGNLGGDFVSYVDLGEAGG